MIVSIQAESRPSAGVPARSMTAAAAAQGTSPAEAAEPALPVSLLELELSLASFDGDDSVFGATVRAAAQAAGGELLFELPASGLLQDCRKIAVIHIPTENDQGKRITLVVLDAKATAIRMEEPGPSTAGLVRLAEAFVDVLKRI